MKETGEPLSELRKCLKKFPQCARNLRVRRLNVVGGDVPIAALAARTMTLNASIQEGQIWLGDGERTVTLDCVSLQDATTG